MRQRIINKEVNGILHATIYDMRHTICYMLLTTWWDWDWDSMYLVLVHRINITFVFVGGCICHVEIPQLEIT